MTEEAAPAIRLTRRLRAVLFVDVVESVRLIHQDAEGTVRRWREFMTAVTRDELPGRQGRMVKPLGDGMLVEFESAIDAVECALAMQSRIERGNSGLPPDQHIRIRIGIHLADVMADDLDLYGDGVNLAARLMGLAGPQEIFVSAAVRDQLTDGLDVGIEDLGERMLKGFDRPVRAFRAWPPGPLPKVSPNRARHAGDRPSIAVLPFRNLSGNPAHDFLGDLIAEDVIGDLSRLTDLFVISRLSTTPFRDRQYEPRHIAEALGVRYVLSGSMHTSGDRLRLMAELVEAGAGHVIWAERFEGSLADVFDLQDHLSQAIARRVVPYVRQLELQRARSAHPDSMTAYERTLRAIEHFHCSSRRDLDQAQALLEAAIQSDAAYVAPYAWLAHLAVRRVGQGWSDDPARDTAEAHRYSDAALQRDPTDPLALTVSGLVMGYLNKDPEGAIVQHNRALTINPSASSAWLWSASAHAWLGQGEEAVRRVHRAIELSPFDPQMYMFNSIAGTAHAVAGEYDQAIDACRRSLRQNRMFASTHRILAISLALSGRVAEALAAGEELLKVEPTLTVARFTQRYPGAGSAHAPVFAGALADAGVPP